MLLTFLPSYTGWPALACDGSFLVYKYRPLLLPSDSASVLCLDVESLKALPRLPPGECACTLFMCFTVRQLFGFGGMGGFGIGRGERGRGSSSIPTKGRFRRGGATRQRFGLGGTGGLGIGGGEGGPQFPSPMPTTGGLARGRARRQRFGLGGTGGLGIGGGEGEGDSHCSSSMPTTGGLATDRVTRQLFGFGGTGGLGIGGDRGGATRHGFRLGGTGGLGIGGGEGGLLPSSCIPVKGFRGRGEATRRFLRLGGTGGVGKGGCEVARSGVPCWMFASDARCREARNRWASATRRGEESAPACSGILSC